ncbi:MAG: ATP phosphoribosyltransferase regulatory subunit [Spirulina sp. SIO3F2]|nr:ATP phosphoribosyltransferase regulatory subunit [Spirulina sp. SIO3F2]
MIHQPPAGTKDLLPLEVIRKRWIAGCLRDVFNRWGYQRIITSTLEWLDTLTAGDAIKPETVIQVDGASQGRLGLRPELTASIARAAVTRMVDDTLPLRLYYNANVFRRAQQGHHGRQLEFYQMGVELLGAGGNLADTEILLLLIDSLTQLGLTDWHIILGEANLTRALLAQFPSEHRAAVRQAIVNLDRLALAALPLSDDLQTQAQMLFELRGEPEVVLGRVSQLELDSASRQIVNELKTLIARLRQTNPGQPLPITLDLTLLETIDYYTGVVFEVVSSQQYQYRVLGKGGRYDQLLGLYEPQGQSQPGIGFALNIEDLQTCLLDSDQLPQHKPTNDWLVIPKTPAAEASAFVYGQQLRQDEHYLVRVEMMLEHRSPEAIRDYAQASGIRRLAWVDTDGTPEIEVIEER